MDLYKIIRELHDEKKRLDSLIASLESLLVTRDVAQPAGERRRGRKAMSQEERLKVSERMREYWANRRKKGVRAIMAHAAGAKEHTEPIA